MTTLHDLLSCYEAEKNSNRDPRTVSPSDLGTLCRRQLAYRLTGAMPTDDAPAVTVATVGSLIHLGVAALWDEDPDTDATEVATPGGGTADVVQGQRVRDTKSVSRAKFDRWTQLDPPDTVWDQALVYAGRLGAADGWTVTIDAICRETGRCATWDQPYQHERYLMAEKRLADLLRLAEKDPDTVPAERDGWGDWYCDTCPWATRCLGDDDRPTPGELSEDEVAVAAADYLFYKAAAREAEATANRAKNLLRGVTGDWGGYRIAWRHVDEAEVPAYTRRGYSTLTIKEVPR